MIRSPRLDDMLELVAQPGLAVKRAREGRRNQIDGKFAGAAQQAGRNDVIAVLVGCLALAVEGLIQREAGYQVKVLPVESRSDFRREVLAVTQRVGLIAVDQGVALEIGQAAVQQAGAGF